MGGFLFLRLIMAIGLPPNTVVIGQTRFDKTHRDHSAALASALEMMRERNLRLRAAGKQPLIPLQSGKEKFDSPYTKQYEQDVILSYKQLANDRANLAAGKPLTLLYSKDGIPTFTPDRIKQRRFEESLIDQKEKDKALVKELLQETGNEYLALVVSQKTATDPLTQMVAQSQTQTALGIKEQALPQLNIKGQLDLPSDLGSGGMNYMDSEQQLILIRNVARGQIEGAPEYYRKRIQLESEDLRGARDYAFFKDPDNRPKVQIIPSHNPELDPYTLRTPWKNGGQASRLPPIVRVTVTPAKKPLPSQGLASALGFAGAIVGAFVPVLGVALAVASAAEAQSVAKSFKVELDMFRPQYYPQPFDVVLPLDQAQMAVAEPWYVPALAKRFQETLATGDLNLINAVLVDRNPPPDLRGVPQSPKGLNDQLLSIITNENPSTPYVMGSPEQWQTNPGQTLANLVTVTNSKATDENTDQTSRLNLATGFASQTLPSQNLSQSSQGGQNQSGVLAVTGQNNKSAVVILVTAALAFFFFNRR